MIRACSHIDFAPALPQSKCIFEHVYFSRPDSLIFGVPVQEAREAMGRQVAREAPVEADIVVPVPDSGVTAAMGYSFESGIPLQFGLIRNHYVGRTFIEPEQRVRDFGVKLKLNPVRAILKGKRVVLFDDSIVRGTTSKKIVRMIRDAGAKEVHMRISCPPTISPCYYGVDTPNSRPVDCRQERRWRKSATSSAPIRWRICRLKDCAWLAASVRDNPPRSALPATPASIRLTG